MSKQATFDFASLPALSTLAVGRARAFWRHLAWQLVPEAFVGAAGDDGTPLPDAAQAGLLALVRGLHSKEVNLTGQRERAAAALELRTLVELGPAPLVDRAADERRPIGRLDLACALLQLEGSAQLALELIVVSAIDPVTNHAARVLAGRVGRHDGQALALLSDCWNAAGLGAGTLQGLCAPRGRLVQVGAVAREPTHNGPLITPTPTLLAYLDDRYDAASPLGEHAVQFNVPVGALAVFEEVRASWLAVAQRSLSAGRPLLISGRAGFGGPALAEMLSDRLGLPCHMIHAAPLVDQGAARPSSLLPELHAHARLNGSMVVLHHVERLSEHFTAHPDSLRHFAAAIIAIRRPIMMVHEGPVANELASQLAVEAAITHLPLPPLTPAERHRLLAACLLAGGVAADQADTLAKGVASYSLGVEQVATAALFAGQRAEQRAARQQVDSGELSMGPSPPTESSRTAPTPAELRLACATAATDRLRRYGSRVEGSAGWDDLVLPEDTIGQLRDIARFARVRDRLFDELGFGRKHDYGRALSAMFSGPSGTGKTMCAGLVAREVGLELYRVDLSRVVSKYIGETEQRLGALFDEATQVGAALLFDEADSLFAKRTEIKSSHDRYANLEVNYLLQRLEDFDGLVVLTTNFATSIDDAFVRRLRFRVEFRFPGKKDRAALWQRMLPPELPLDEEDPLELDWLGEAFELSGGHIKNTMLRAGMMAADRPGGLSMRMLYDAAAAEYRELGKIAPPYAFAEEDW